MDVNRRTVLKGGAAVGALGWTGAAIHRDADADVARSADWGDQDEPADLDGYETHYVSQAGDGFDSIQEAVNEASAGDLVLIEPGIYDEAVENHDTPRLTIRGLDRNEVLIDGEFERYNGILITADDVVVENLTVRNHNGNGVYWTNVEGYRGSYLTAYNNVEYGIYAFSARYGRFEHCYASGSDDAGYYIGESQPADAVITDCIAENNAMGYSGTNAGGNLVIRDSLWRNNMTGIVPNTLDSQQGAPQGHVAGGIRIENNEIHDNNNLNAPAYELAYPLFGNGITIAGGTKNDVVGNHIYNQEKYGIAVTPLIDEQFYRPTDNAIMHNTIEDSGRVDVALAAPASSNEFSDNDASSFRPVFLERRSGSIGDVWVLLQLFKDYLQADLTGNYHRGEVPDQPAPDDQPNMADPADAPPAEPVGGRYA